VYRYIIREVVPGDAKNAEGITWDDATEEQRASGGFVKDDVSYDGTIYYMKARVTSWDQTGADGNTYKAYGLSKTYYTDDKFSTVSDNVQFVDFRNTYAPKIGEVEFNKVDADLNALPGAEFTLYLDSECTKLAKDLDGDEQVVTSDGDGNIVFDNIAVRTYYMKETSAPENYQIDDTVYTVIIEDANDTEKHSRIVIETDDNETEINRILNTKNGEFTVIKEWQDHTGKAVSGGKRTARIKIQRRKYHTQQDSHRIKFKIQISGRDDLVYNTTKYINGNVVTIDWWDTNQQIKNKSVTDNSGHNLEYDLTDYWDDINHKNRKVVVSDVSSDLNINITYPSDRDWLFNSEHTPWMKNVSIVGSYVANELVEDEEFNISNENNHFEILSAPNWSKKWTIGGTETNHRGYDFPASDGTNPYEYYVVEVNEDGQLLVIDQDTQHGYKLKGYKSVAGGITVFNEILETDVINLKIRKTDNVENTNNYLSGAVFELEYRSNSNSSWIKANSVPNMTIEELNEDSQFVVPYEGITLTGLIDGKYTIKEITPPVGYVITNSNPVTFMISDGQVNLMDGTSDNVKYIPATGESDDQINIPNAPGSALPSTGGFGTTSIYFSGAMVTILAGATLIKMQIRRRNVE
jgi:hypothetical protein